MDFRATMLLADSAQAVGGKLYVLGGGWSICGPDPMPMAIAVDIKVPWHLAAEEHTFRLQLLNADGRPVTVENDSGEQQISLEGTFRVGEPVPGVKAGTPMDGCLAVNVGPIPLPSGDRFEWRLWINGQTREDWNLGFTTRPAAASEAA
jgi:hypothetical protein